MPSSPKTGLILLTASTPLAVALDWSMTQKNVEPFGKRLAQWRREKGFSQGEFAEKIGVSQRVLCYYERETKYPPTHLLSKISETLGKSLDELMGTEQLPPEAKRKGNPQLKRKLRLVEDLPKQDQKAVLRYIDALVFKNTKTA